MSQLPLLIGGAGAAGLSLAVHLLERGVRRRILLFDPRQRYSDDRTWCYWHFDSHPFEACVSHRWHRWRVAAPGREAVTGSANHPYCHIRGEDFYRYARELIDAAPNVEQHLGVSVLGVSADGDRVQAETTGGTVAGDFFFDSRPPRPGRGLVQHFAGLFVETPAPVFTPGTVTLMDFAVPALPGVAGPCFMYLLPFSSRQALVESTAFSPWKQHPPGGGRSAATHRAAVEAYLERHHPGIRYEVRAEERGEIPMAVLPAPAGGRILPIGTAAGCARASSGYAFDAIQRTSRDMADAVCRGADPSRVQIWRRRARWLDRIFLSFLEHRPELAPRVFASLFGRLSGDVMPRFLSDRESAIDVLRVMTAMPTGVFAREWLRTQGATAS